MSSDTFATAYHAPVLAREVVELLGKSRHVLDGTLGGGGHTAALLHCGVRVTAIDQDPSALATSRERLKAHMAHGQLALHEVNFAELDSVPALDGITFDGVLLDLGVSSHQLDEQERGFTFRRGALLDMRMQPSAERTAADLLNHLTAQELSELFRANADEPRARRLANEIVRRRANQPFALSDDFVGAIRAVFGSQAGPSDFARLFQGLRIAVNDEFHVLTRALPMLRDRLEPDGVMAVITYHSGEDRIVKRAMAEWSRGCTCPPKQPVCTCGGTALGEPVMRKGVVATDDEILHNPRARSARLRAWRRAA